MQYKDIHFFEKSKFVSQSTSIVFTSILLLITAITLAGCSSTKLVPIETVKTEYKDVDTTALFNHLSRIFKSQEEKESRMDSVIDRSRETIILNEFGDTTRHDRIRFTYISSSREKELERLLTEKDSMIADLRFRLNVAKTDSIMMPYLVEHNPTIWQKVKHKTVIVFSCLTIVVVIAWIILKKAKSFRF